MKKALALVLSIALLLTFMVGCANSTPESSKQSTETENKTESKTTDVEKDNAEAAPSEVENEVPTIKIGHVAHITGGNSQNGYYQTTARDIFVDWINANGGIKSMGGAKIEVVTVDTMTDATQAKTSTERLLEDDEICTVICNPGSSYTVALCPVFEKAEVPVITVNYANAITESGYKWVHSVSQKSSEVGPLQIEYLNWLKEEYGYETNKVALIYVDTEYGVNNASGVRERIQSSGLELVMDEAYPPDITDASALVTKMIQSGAEAVFSTNQFQDGKLIFSTMKAMNYQPVIIGGGQGLLSSQIIDAFGEDVVGVCSTAIFNWDQKQFEDDPELLEMMDEWKEITGEPFVAENALSIFSALSIVVDSLERTGTTDRTALRDAIAGYSGDALVPNENGGIDFDETGYNINARHLIVQWQEVDGSYAPRVVYPDKFASGGFKDYKNLN